MVEGSERKGARDEPDEISRSNNLPAGESLEDLRDNVRSRSLVLLLETLLGELLAGGRKGRRKGLASRVGVENRKGERKLTRPS